MSGKVTPLKWLTDYIKVIENADTDCEQKLILPELREVKNLLSMQVGMTKPVLDLLEDVALELQKSGNEDATNLLDRIDRTLHPARIFYLNNYDKASLIVSDFVPEFIDKLIDQLKLDHNRWGNTWLHRPKEGQEFRTLARWTDYFDQFEQTGTPVPWLKVVGGALICWIRENHPELCPDVNEVIADDMKKIGFGIALVDQEAEEAFKDSLKELRDKVYIKHTDDTGKTEVIGIKVSPEGVEDIRTEGSKIKTILLEEAIADEAERAAEEPEVEPEEEVPEEEKPVEEMTTKELIELPSVDPFPIAHVCNERIENIGQGTLAHAFGPTRSRRIILESIKFTNGPSPGAPVLGVCNKDGVIIPGHSVKSDDTRVGVLGWVDPDGRYKLTAVRGVGFQDIIYVSYDCEFKLPV